MERVLSDENGQRYLHTKAIKFLWTSGIGCNGVDVWASLPPDVKGMLVKKAGTSVSFTAWCLLGKGMLAIALKWYEFDAVPRDKYWVYQMLFNVWRRFDDANRKVYKRNFLDTIKTAGVTLEQYVLCAHANLRLDFLSSFLRMFYIDHEMHPFHRANEDDKYPQHAYDILRLLKPFMCKEELYAYYIDVMYVRGGREQSSLPFTREETDDDICVMQKSIGDLNARIEYEKANSGGLCDSAIGLRFRRRIFEDALKKYKQP
jgi:hypothetical protein